ncbi:MAG: hypothetical protein JNK05_36060 [Myxococcales bacterium]|nr:hypothetical protein [Myxococcales bacterium]
MTDSTRPIYPVGTKIFLDGSSGAYTVVEHIVAPFAKGAYDGRPCAPGEQPTHYNLQNHLANRVLVETHAVLREAVAREAAIALVEALRTGPAESLDELARQGLVVNHPAPKGARAYDVNRLDLSIEDNVRVLRAYYALDEAAFAEGPAAWISSFERVVLGELALVLDATFEDVRAALHRAHPGVAAYDAKADERAAARRAAMERAKKRKKTRLPLP